MRRDKEESRNEKEVKIFILQKRYEDRVVRLEERRLGNKSSVLTDPERGHRFISALVVVCLYQAGARP
jgi:hypothetical protein